MQTDSFTTPDGLNIHTKYWKYPGESQRVVIIVHGYAEHSGRYVHVAESLRDAGYHVYALDHRGHGQSDGVRAHVTGHTDFIRDLKLFHGRIRENHPDATIFILGHSMGALITSQFIITYPDAVGAATIISLPIHMAKTQPGYVATIARVVSRVNSKIILLPAVENVVLTRDEEMVQDLANDPLHYTGGARVSMGVYHIDIGKWVEERIPEIAMPILVIGGGADDFVPLSGTETLYEKASSTDKTLKIWEGMLHEPLNEIGREEVIETIIEWFNKH